MLVADAYDLVMVVVDYLDAYGVEVVKEEVRYSGRESKSVLDPSKWVKFTFCVDSKEHLSLVTIKKTSLQSLGIHFDTSTYYYKGSIKESTSIEWFIDWSFEVISTADGEDTEVTVAEST